MLVCSTSLARHCEEDGIFDRHLAHPKVDNLMTASTGTTMTA
jgi:hypothetical protein